MACFLVPATEAIVTTIVAKAVKSHEAKAEEQTKGHAPIAKESRKVAVIGPEATPPESNAIAVKIFGTKNVRIRATA